MKTLLLLILFSALTLSAADVTGKWSGSFEATNDEGETRNERAYLVLKQDGSKLTGSAGPSEDAQSAIQSGNIEGDQLTFSVEHKGRVYTFKLALDGDTLKGEISNDREGQPESHPMTLKRVKE